MQIYRGNEMN